MYLLLKYVPVMYFQSRRNTLLTLTHIRFPQDIEYLYELRVEFTDDYSQFSSYICECNFKTEADTFEVYGTPFQSTEKNREMYDEYARYQKTTNFDCWLQGRYLTPPPYDQCPSCFTHITTMRSNIYQSIDYYSNKHFLILELPEAPIDTIVGDLLKYSYGFGSTNQFKQECGQLLRDIKFLSCNHNDYNKYIPMLLAYQKEKWTKHTQKYIRTMLLPEIEKRLQDWKPKTIQLPIYEPEDEINLDMLD
jgi:hypothetical protein